jgi:hypothetical protein
MKRKGGLELGCLQKRCIDTIQPSVSFSSLPVEFQEFYSLLSLELASLDEKKHPGEFGSRKYDPGFMIDSIRVYV